MSGKHITFINARLCIGGQLVSKSLTFSPDSGEIVSVGDGGHDRNNGTAEAETIDMKGAIIAPGFIEVQTNGMRGFHFTHFIDAETYMENLKRVAEYLPRTGEYALVYMA